MTEIAIQIQNVSKQYRLGTVGTGTLSNDLKRWWYNVRGKEDPFLKIGTENKLGAAGGEYVWALKDINFEVKQGEILGIIGKNGAGKSTLLKLLSRVTTPTTGSINVKGRIASLLEVGTGFHPELTGRENIFLNGAILGMTKQEIKNKFDEIVDFSGVEKYIDTPVKRYSSGMYVRLAFAVAAHLDPEILVVDEVLAVGDAEFQKKALGKMQDISKGGGRTVLFVSHNMASILALCNTGILISKGRINYHGNIQECVNKYIISDNILSGIYLNEIGNNELYIKKIQVFNQDQILTSSFQIKDAIILKIEIINSKKLNNTVFTFIIYDNRQIPIFSSHKNINSNAHFLKAIIPYRTLQPGAYYIKCFIHEPNVRFIDLCNDSLIQIAIDDTGTEHSIYRGTDLGMVLVNVNWESEENK